MPYSWRPITPGDVPAWAELLADAERREPTGEHLSQEELTEDLADPALDAATATTAAWREDQMVAYGAVRVRDSADPVHQVRAEAMVHPDHRSHDLAARLIGWIEDAALRQHQRSFPGSPLEIHAMVHDNQRWMAEILTGAGFEPERYFVEMTMDLSDPVPQRPKPDELTLVAYDSSYAEPVRLARNDTFAGHWGSVPISAESWRHKVGASTFRPELSYLLLDRQGEVAAFALSSYYAADHQATGRKEVFITDVGTRTPWRNRGLAGALIRHVLALARQHGYDGARLSVDHASESGALDLYARIGFAPVERWATYVRTLTQPT